ncbi:PPIase cyclophilin-type domain-containing protein [Plasmodiophora brassicae]|uniref:PPIase cyclophilin-type domain-containing protein n=1 Tax=Plasmodiophora brassicae TaxID=37360 RepID=A0A0G4IM56_PLABS|nr:hypothetical protein PBRA_004862 [Plasmodiophora brassicae]
MSTHVFVELASDLPGASLGRVVFELFTDRTPLASENFRRLCVDDGEQSYRGTRLHRVVRGLLIGGGDIVNGDGRGAWSIYGTDIFDDDPERIEVDRAGLLCTATLGKPNTNTCQFFISMAPAAHLTSQTIVFGRVAHGMDVLRVIERMETLPNERPIYEVRIAHCGQCKVDWSAPVDPLDPYPGFPEDHPEVLEISDKMEISHAVRQLGNDLFWKGEFELSLRKYDKALKYLEEDLLATPEEEELLMDARVTCWLNQALAWTRIGRYQEAIGILDTVLHHRPGNVKAVRRREIAVEALKMGDREAVVANARRSLPDGDVPATKGR